MPSSRGIFPTQGSNLYLMSPALAGRFFTTNSLQIETEETWASLLPQGNTFFLLCLCFEAT